MPPKLAPSDAEDLVRRYLAGETMKQLGAAFDISSRSVTDYLRRAGLPGGRPRGHHLQSALDAMPPEVLAAKRSEAMRLRWEFATPEQRAAMLEPAHEGARRPMPDEVKQRIVQAKERRSGSDSPYEQQVAEWLTERGVEFRQQVAVGEHCADFAVGRALVEVTTGWARKKEWRPRFTRFFDEGWHLYVIWHDTRVPLLPVVADDLVAWTKLIEATPPEGSQHRVVWRSRQVLSTGGGDAEYVASVLKSATPRGRWPLYDGAGDQA